MIFFEDDGKGEDVKQDGSEKDGLVSNDEEVIGRIEARNELIDIRVNVKVVKLHDGEHVPIEVPLENVKGVFEGDINRSIFIVYVSVYVNFLNFL